MAEKSFGLKQINMIGVGTPAIESSDDLIIKTNGSERVRILSGGNIGIGLTNPDTELHIKTNSATGPTIRLEGTAPMGADDLIGGIDFFNIDGSGNGPQVGVSLRAYTEGAGGNGGYLIVGVQDSTTGSEGADTQEAFRVTTAGNIAFPSGQGIDFSATTDATGMDNELLDDYEEGTFTPTLRDTNNGGGTAATVGVAVGSYTKVGNLCSMAIRLSQITSTTGMTSANQIFIGNLPFLINNTVSNSIFIGPAELSSFNTDSGCVNVAAFVNASSANQTDTRIFQTIDNAGHTSLKVSNIVPASNCEIFINLVVPVV